MGLFKSKEEKEAEKAAKMHEWLDARGLDDIKDDSLKQIERIKTSLWGTSFMSGMNGLFGNEKDVIINVSYMIQGITEQNWLLIKQNDQLRKQNDELIKLLKDQLIQNNKTNNSHEI